MNPISAGFQILNPDTTATDIASGGGKIWAIGTGVGQGAGNAILRLDSTGWTSIPGAATRIAVNSQGNAWIVNTQKFIYRYCAGHGRFEPIGGEGRAVDIAVGGEPSNEQVFVTAQDSLSVWRYDSQLCADMPWKKLPAPPNTPVTAIAVDKSGRPWIVAKGQVYRGQ